MSATLRKILIFGGIMAVVLLTGLVGRKAYKRATERHMLSEAASYLAKDDVRNTSLCLERALQLNPFSLRATSLMGDVLERGGAPAAVKWRERAVQLSAADSNLRLAWAATALKFHEPTAADKALSGVDEKTKSGVAYLKLAGALAWETGRIMQAETMYAEAFKREPGNPAVRFNLATIRLASTNNAQAELGRQDLKQMALSGDFKFRALEYLKADATAHSNLEAAFTYSKSILQQTNATLADRMDHLQLMRALKEPGLQAWRAELEQDAKHSSATAFALGQWMLTVEGPTNTFHWLQALPVTIQTNQPVPLVMADCYLLMNDWNGLLASVTHQAWGQGDCFRLALEARAENELGDTMASRTAWENALRLGSHNVEQLARLSQLSVKWGWSDQHLAVMKRIVADFPEACWAKDKLMAELYNSGNSSELQRFLSESFESDPANASIKNNFASICLLRKSGLESAYRLAEEAYESEPSNPYFISTYAYSLLLQKRSSEAEKIASEIKPEFLKIPSIAAYYGIVEAGTGHKENARAALKRAETAPLLPEEKELVRVAESNL